MSTLSSHILVSFILDKYYILENANQCFGIIGGHDPYFLFSNEPIRAIET